VWKLWGGGGGKPGWYDIIYWYRYGIVMLPKISLVNAAATEGL